jgi:hypothetical protein
LLSCLAFRMSGEPAQLVESVRLQQLVSFRENWDYALMGRW